MLRLVFQSQRHVGMVIPAVGTNRRGIFFRLGPQNIRIRCIFVKNCNSLLSFRRPFPQPAENLRLCPRNILQASQKFDMHRINIRYNRNIRLRQLRQIFDFPARRHSHFNHRIAGSHIQIQQRPRHADMVVEVAIGRICRRKPAQYRL